MSKIIFDCIFYYNNPRNGIHMHNYYEVCFVLEGSGEFHCEGVCYKINKNTLFIGPPLVNHEIIWTEKEPLKLSFFTFSLSSNSTKAQLLKQDLIIKDFLNKHNICIGDCSHIRTYFEMLSKYVSCNGKYGIDEIQSTMLMDIMLSLSTVQDLLLRRADNPITQEITNFIRGNIWTKITINDICNHVNMSERTIFNFFNKQFGTTPINYINSLKMSTAVGYLDMGFNVKNVAVILGFPDISSFSRMFKKYYKVSPTKFTEKHFVNL
jgi:AraC-like DNA-binding protein